MQSLHALAAAAIELAQDAGAVAAVQDAARSHVVGAEIDEGADDILDADHAADDEFIEAVLEGGDIAARGQMRRAARATRLRYDAPSRRAESGEKCPNTSSGVRALARAR